MCGPSSSSSSSSSSSKGGPLRIVNQEECASNQQLSHLDHTRQWCRKLLPLPPLVLVVCLPPFLFSTSAYLNRGFTIWFHWLCLAGWLTQNDMLRKFIVVVGTSICLGWYSSILADFMYFDRPVFRLLYKNMLPSMSQIMVDESTGNLYYHSKSIAMMVLSHILDGCGHPGLVYYFWREHTVRHRGGGGGRRLVGDLVSWPAIASAFLYSRAWSMVHNYYNFGQMGYFYFGYNIYNIDCLTQWYPAYIAETVFFGSVVLFKLWTIRCDFHMTTTSKTNKSKELVDDKHHRLLQPALVYSESSMESFCE